MALLFSWMTTTKEKLLVLLVISFIGSQLLLVSHVTMRTLKRMPADIHRELPMESGGKDKQQDNLDYSQLNNESSAEAGDIYFTDTASRHASEYQLNENNRRCGKGHFQLNNDGICHPWLTCEEIQNNVTVMKYIGGGWVKRAYLAKWKEYRVTLVNKSDIIYDPDWFERGARTLLQFQPSPFVTQLIGYCPSIPVIVTEYHRFGSLENMNEILKENHKDNIATRYRLSLDYVKIIHFLHTNPNGTYVMCDSSALSKILEQYLLTTDFHIVLNDLDRLPVVNSPEGKFTEFSDCGSVIDTTFAAPEQLLRADGLNPVFDEKTDIWQIPPVVDHLLGNSFDASVVKSHLSKLHQQCRSTDPKLRPTANEILKEYLEVQKELNL